MTITYHPEMIQGSDEWMDARRGLITAGSMKLILTPTLKMASNEKERTHLYELLAQRATGYTEPDYISDDMLRGMGDEIYARALYSENYEEVTECGLVTNDEWGFTIAYSPDGLVGDEGMIECKSRKQKFQAQTIIEDEVPVDYMLQLQAGLMVTRRKWIDFISYCGGMPMFVKRVYPVPAYIDAITEAATAFDFRIAAAMKTYARKSAVFYPTERRVETEIIA